MMHRLCLAMIGFVVCAAVGGPVDSARAGTIIDMTNTPPAIHIQFDGTTLSTAGAQSTAAFFTGFLDWYPDITSLSASLAFDGVTKSGSPLVNGTSILQQFSGGTLALYDAAQTLLLSGKLSSSALSGTAGLADGGLFTTSFSTVTGGVFAPYVDRPSLVFQMHLSNINGGSGLSTATPTIPALQPFTASVDANIDGSSVPEPTTAVLVAILFTLTLALALPRSLRR